MLNKKQVYDLINNYDIAMVTNVNESGKLVSHPMTRQGKVNDDVLWFFSERNSEKIIEMTKNRSVNVAFSGDDYISISGEAEVVDDVEMKKELWSKAVEAFYKGGPEDDEIILLKVNIDSLEYWTTDNIVKSSFEFAKAMVSDEKPDVGENEAIDL